MLVPIRRTVNFASCVALLSISSLACSKSLIPTAVVGNKHVVQETRDVRDFSSITVSDNLELDVDVGPAYSVRVEAEENLMQYIKVYRDGSKLVLAKANGLVINRKPIKITVSTPDLSKVEGQGSPSIHVDHISGSSFEAITSGNANVQLTGSTQDLHLKADGSGELDATGLEAAHVVVHGTGSTNFEVFAQDTLKVKLSGACNVKYKGQPEVDSDLSGASHVSAL